MTPMTRETGSSVSTSAATSSSRRRLPAPVRTSPAREQISSDHNDGWMMAVELVTATLTWGGIGYLVDRFLTGTYPVFMSIGFVVGFFAGMYLLWLKTSRPAAQQGPAAAANGDATVTAEATGDGSDLRT